MPASIERNYRYVELTINRLSSPQRGERGGRGFRIGEKLRNEEEGGRGRGRGGSCIGAREIINFSRVKSGEKKGKSGVVFKFRTTEKLR